MIPVRLQLKNFMSYGESVPPLELAGINLAVLSGENGNGKTALLDAMTWALFGETRAQAEDDIVRLGATDCSVILDFVVESQKYRIRRSRGGKGTIWELQAWQEDGSLRPMSGNSARETKARIQGLLRMDYKTFLATGYLAQGRADEFARATISDRKKVLADILDLARYERLEALAKEKRKEAEDKELDVDRSLASIDKQLEAEDGYHFALEAAQKNLTLLQENEQILRDAFEKQRGEVERMEADEEKVREWESGIADRDEANKRDARDRDGLLKRIAQAEDLTAQTAQIEQKYARYTQLNQDMVDLQEKFRQVRGLQREAQDLDNAIRTEQEALDRERYRVECDVDKLVNEAKDETRYENELLKTNAQIGELGDGEAEAKRADDARRKADESVVELRAALQGLKADQARLQKRMDALSASDAAACEYCAQELPPAKRQQALGEAHAEWDALAAQMKAITTRGKAAKADVEKCQAVQDDVQKKQRLLDNLRLQQAQANQELHRLRKRTETLPSVRKHLNALSEKLARRDYAHEAQERRLQVSALLEKNERVEQQYNDAQQELKTLSGIERTQAQLQAAQEIMHDDPPRVAEFDALIAKRVGQIEKARTSIDKVRFRTAALPQLRRHQAELSAQLQNADAAARQADREIGQATERIAHCETLKTERTKRIAERAEYARDKDIYKELAAAFGKKGVQALIIENALPEIEEQANSLLGRMTQGAMRVELKTQREARTKSVGQIETLDIIISDEAGTRPYEMFSGGEAYRINFALRVALSKMLAKRAGAPLQTLILDEGFGTQDGRGREAIADALHTIADEFALILVITHIEELKEAFPTRIEVVKGPGGSSFSVA